MFKRVIIAGGIAVILALAVVGYLVFRTPQSASSPIEAIPLATTVATSAAQTTTDSSAATAATTDTSAAQSADTSATAAPTAEAAEESASAASTAQIFEIVSAESEARFLIDEVLRGAPVTVVGATDQVAGQIAIDTSEPSSAQVGIIQINARTLATDNDFRNRAIKNAILNTDSYEFVTFTPTAISGLPASVTVGEAFTFQMTGDLTVKDTTQSVTFDVTVTPTSETELSGTASTSILYSDFNLNIPDSPQVDTVADEVRLELDFVAKAVVA